jgi:hypothetical protein
LEQKLIEIKSKVAIHRLIHKQSDFTSEEKGKIEQSSRSSSDFFIGQKVEEQKQDGNKMMINTDLKIDSFKRGIKQNNSPHSATHKQLNKASKDKRNMLRKYNSPN